jgi:hypothetical protein
MWARNNNSLLFQKQPLKNTIALDKKKKLHQCSVGGGTQV